MAGFQGGLLSLLPACQLPGPLLQVCHAVAGDAGEWLPPRLLFEPSLLRDQGAVSFFLT